MEGAEEGRREEGEVNLPVGWSPPIMLLKGGPRRLECLRTEQQTQTSVLLASNESVNRLPPQIPTTTSWRRIGWRGRRNRMDGWMDGWMKA